VRHQAPPQCICHFSVCMQDPTEPCVCVLLVPCARVLTKHTLLLWNREPTNPVMGCWLWERQLTLLLTQCGWSGRNRKKPVSAHSPPTEQLELVFKLQRQHPSVSLTGEGSQPPAGLLLEPGQACSKAQESPLYQSPCARHCPRGSVGAYWAGVMGREDRQTQACVLLGY
jgi:hypothetical protein